MSRVDLASGVVTPVWTIATNNGNNDYAYDIAADDTRVFFAGLTQMMAAPVVGGKETIISAAPSYFAINSTDIFAAIVMSESQVSLIRAAKDGSSSTPIVPQFGPNQPAADDANVYWAEWGGGGNVQRVPVAGGTITTFATTPSKSALSFTIGLDEAYVYWATFDDTGLVELHRKDK